MATDNKNSVMQVAHAIIIRDLRAHHTRNQKYELNMLIARYGRLYLAHDLQTGRLTVLYSTTPEGVKQIVLDTDGAREYKPGIWIDELLAWFKQVQSIPIYKLHVANKPGVN